MSNPRALNVSGIHAVLAADLAADDTEATIEGGGETFPEAGFQIQLASEVILVGSRDGNTFSDLVRGLEGTTAVPHNAGEAVDLVVGADLLSTVASAPIFHGTGAPTAPVNARFSIASDGDVNAEGTYRLSFRGQPTDLLAFDATGAEIAAALEALPAIGAGNCIPRTDYADVAPNDGTFAVFAGDLAGHPIETPTVIEDTTDVGIVTADDTTGAAGDPATALNGNFYVDDDTDTMYVLDGRIETPAWRSTGGGNGGSQTVKTLEYNVAFDAANLNDGVTLYTFAPGEWLLDVALVITQAWNGTTPLIDGIIGSNLSGVFATVGLAAIDATVPSATGNFDYPNDDVFQAVASLAMVWAQGGVNSGFPIRVGAAVPFKAFVSQDGNRGGADPGSSQGAAKFLLTIGVPS